MTEGRKFTVETVNNAWSWINGPDGYREGPYRYHWEAEDFAEMLERGELLPEYGDTRVADGERGKDGK